MEGFWTGGDKSQTDATSMQRQGKTKVLFLFSLKLDDSARAFETAVFFSRPKRFLHRVHHEKCQAGCTTTGIKISGRNINNLRYADNTTLRAESKEELKSLLMKVKENEKAGLKLNIQKRRS